MSASWFRKRSFPHPGDRSIVLHVHNHLHGSNGNGSCVPVVSCRLYRTTLCASHQGSCCTLPVAAAMAMARLRSPNRSKCAFSTVKFILALAIARHGYSLDVLSAIREGAEASVERSTSRPGGAEIDRALLITQFLCRVRREAPPGRRC